MTRLLIGLVVGYVLVVSAAFVLGLRVEDHRSFSVHFGLGLFATIYTCFIYCVVLTYFVITGKLIKQAVLRGHLSSDHIQQSQSNKAKMTGISVLAMTSSLGAAVLGASIKLDFQSPELLATWHMMAQCCAVVINLGSFGLIYQVIQRNSQQVNRVFELLCERQKKVTVASWETSGNNLAVVVEKRK